MRTTPAAVLRRARETSRLTRAELASLAGVSHTTVLRIEKNEMSPTFEMLSKLLMSAGFMLDVDAVRSCDDLRVWEAVTAAQKGSAEIERLKTAGLTSPVQFREDLRVVRVELSRMVDWFQKQGVDYAVSALEGLQGQVPQGKPLSFWPVVYADYSAKLPWPEATGAQRGSVYVLPMSDRTRECSEDLAGVSFMWPDWSVVDLIASPDRQADIGLELLDEQRRLRSGKAAA